MNYRVLMAWPDLERQDDGTLVVVWPVRRVRFLLDDGQTVDVLTTHDSSDMRGALLVLYPGRAIVGSTDVPDPSDEPRPEPPKRKPRKTPGTPRSPL